MAFVNCAYCGLASQNAAIFCADENFSGWFCNGSGSQLQRSHAVEHLHRARGKCVCAVHDCRRTLFQTTGQRIECDKCKSSNVFDLGFCPVSNGRNRFRFLCRQPSCSKQEQSSGTWKPIVSNDFKLVREIAVPVQLPETNDISLGDIARLEREWAPREERYDGEHYVDLPESNPLNYASREEYSRIWRSVAIVEKKAADAELRKRDREVNVDVTWKVIANSDARIEAIFKLRQMTQGYRLSTGNRVTMSLGGWNCEATVVKAPGNNEYTVCLKKSNRTPIKKTRGFTVAWATNSVPFDRIFQALDTFETTDLLSGLVSDAILGRPSDSAIFEYPDIENVSVAGLPKLNHAQEEAVMYALKNVVSVIEAPPGTGKTTLAAVIAYQLVDSLTTPVLLCAPSNIAVDKLTSTLAKTGIQGIVRLYARWKEDDPEYQAEDPRVDQLALHRRFPSEKGKDQKRVREAQRQALQEASIICCTCITAGGARLNGIKFKTLIIDECTQASENECLVPITRGAIQQLILIGDRKQLGPIVKNKKAKKAQFGLSLFERLGGDDRGVFLDTQYRMHPAISAFPAATFYDSKLRDGVTAEQRLLFIDDESILFPNPKLPVVFISTRNNIRQEEISGAATSFLNHTECGLVVEVLTRLFEFDVQPHQIGVITMYEGQREYLDSYLNNLDNSEIEEYDFPANFYTKIEVNTVDGFQGRENDFIVISCVRSNEKGKIGFLADPKRINVALTRARFGLVILGDPVTLGNCPTWKALIEHHRGQGTLITSLPELE